MPALDQAISAVRRLSRSNWLEVVRRDQCERWRSGEKVQAESYFVRLPELRADRDDAVVLVCGEVQLRREAGESFTLGEYQSRFTDIAAELAAQFEIDRLINAAAAHEHEGEEARAPRLAGYEILREIGR